MTRRAVYLVQKYGYIIGGLEVEPKVAILGPYANNL